jgi:hypothetical protein
LTVSVATFLVRFSEFSKAGTPLLQAALDGVEATTSDEFASDGARDEYVMFSLARSLALSPMGRDAQMVDKKGGTSYDARLEQLRDAQACLNPNRWGTPE